MRKKTGCEMEIDRQQIVKMYNELNKSSEELEKLQAKKQELLKRYEMSIGLDQTKLFEEMKKNEADFVALNSKTKKILETLKALVGKN